MQTEEGEGVAYRSRDEVLHEHHDSGSVRIFSHHEVQSVLVINRVYPLLVDRLDLRGRGRGRGREGITKI